MRFQVCGRIRIGALLLAVAILVLPGTTSAATRQVEWDVTGCDETAVVLDRAPNRDALIALVYRCRKAVIGSSEFSDFSVSEISILQADGTSTLLQQVTNNVVLHKGLRRLGLKDSFLGTIDYESGALGEAPKITVSFGSRSYSFSGRGGASGMPPFPSSGGASYTYEGKKGTIELRYENHTQAATPAVVTVSSNDRRLTDWMGRQSATGVGVVAAGDWTGTASLSD